MKSVFFENANIVDVINTDNLRRNICRRWNNLQSRC